MPWLARRSVPDGLVRIVAGWLVVAATSKFLRPCETLSALRSYAPPLANADVLAGLVALEVSLGVLLFVWPRDARLVRATSVLLLLFTGYLVVGLLEEGLTFRCQCAPGLLELHPVISVVRNLVLIAVLLLARRSRRLGAAAPVPGA